MFDHRHRAVAAPVFVAALLLLGSAAAPLHAEAQQHTLEVGLGWQNTGATRDQTWEPGIQGSRKDVPVHIGWRYTWGSRVYWAPFARAHNTNFWSIGGAGNLVGLDLGAGGIGIALSDPLDDVPAGRRIGHWFATLEVNLANVRLGFNMTPDAPVSDRAPDGDARRAEVRAQRASGEPVDHTIQRYPFGDYAYVTLAFPVRISAWSVLSEQLGVGFFIESAVAAFEWPIGISVSAPAYTYSVIGGATMHFPTPGS